MDGNENLLPISENMELLKQLREMNVSTTIRNLSQRSLEADEREFRKTLDELKHSALSNLKLPKKSKIYTDSDIMKILNSHDNVKYTKDEWVTFILYRAAYIDLFRFEKEEHNWFRSEDLALHNFLKEQGLLSTIEIGGKRNVVISNSYINLFLPSEFETVSLSHFSKKINMESVTKSKHYKLKDDWFKKYDSILKFKFRKKGDEYRFRDCTLTISPFYLLEELDSFLVKKKK